MNQRYRGEHAPTTEVPPHRSRKNTRRWCKGKVGREHVPALRDNPHFGHLGCSGPRTKWSWLRCVEQEYCTVCGKVLRWSLGDDCTRVKA